MKGSGILMTASPRLADLNGKTWTCEVDSKMATDSAIVRVTFQ